MPAHPPRRAAAEARYSGLRLAALDAWRRQWAGHPARPVAWPWDAMMSDYRRHRPSRFELALWSGDVLCGLAVGRTGSAYCGAEYNAGQSGPLCRR